MKSTKMFLVLFIMFFGSLIPYAQTAYAPWAELRPNIPDGDRNSYENMMINTPQRSQIELPPYPGAKIVATSQFTQSIDDSQRPYLPTVTLISSDPAAKIIEVYKEIIQDFPDWHWNARIGIFYKDSLRAALNRHEPYIQVTAVQFEQPDLKYISSKDLEAANSKIVVCYNPESVKED
jgi:hypothetical protein